MMLHLLLLYLARDILVGAAPEEGGDGRRLQFYDCDEESPFVPFTLTPPP